MKEEVTAPAVCVKCGDSEGTYPSGMCKSQRCVCHCVFPVTAERVDEAAKTHCGLCGSDDMLLPFGVAHWQCMEMARIRRSSEVENQAAVKVDEVSAALVELREMFPACPWLRVEVSALVDKQRAPTYQVELHIDVDRSFRRSGLDLSMAFAEAMAAVRDWKKETK